MKTITMTTPDMSCNHCKMTIEKAVKGLPGIKQVNADPETKKVTVDFDEAAISVETIKKSIEDAGYGVKE